MLIGPWFLPWRRRCCRPVPLLRGRRPRAPCTRDGLRDASPLFRHEVAYVLGQLAHPASAPALMRTVADDAEHEMVRHEAAESLGAIGTPDCTDFLEARLAAGGPAMLEESCKVALDITEYWSAEGKEGLQQN